MAAPDPHVIVLFGARGDLAARKLLPGFFRLLGAGLMPEDFRIVGSGRHAPDSHDAFVEEVRDALGKHGAEDVDEERWATFAERISFVASSADDASELAAAVAAAQEELGEGARRLLYLSVPPGAMLGMVEQLGASGLADGARLVVEKPFGTDLDSARELNAALHDVVAEEQVFRIDHFLGKEAAQNVLALRFANGFLEPVWNRDHIAAVQIDVPEELGLEGRASFYEETGAFRDMVVAHLFQLMGFLAMEPPVRMDAGALRDEKAKLFEAVRPLDPSRVVLGQFEGYREEDDVADDSGVETFAAVELHVDTWRWAGVPFLLRTGKAMAAARRTITIAFREPPLRMFGLEDGTGDHARPNVLVLELSDTPSVRLELLAKAPGPDIALAPAAMELSFADPDDGDDRLEAYERLLLDVMLGDHTLFTRADEVERLWAVAAPVLEQRPEVHPYAQGSWGPEAALDLPPRPGWRLPD
ncbi:MAG: glucose-6-phosphate 1-dehydrogenase [Solirubrobacterales bacterium]|nr:glucose-6-phosphate 1-dehydrogenase [Solirubrobacterales bacterium]